MGLISKIKEGLSHTSSEEHVATTKTETTIGSEQVVAIPAEVDVVMEDKVVDVPINTYTAEADKTVIQAEAEEVQVKQAEAIVQEKKDVHAEVEITPVVDRVVDETEVRQTILPVKDEVNEVSAEHRVAATDKRSITEAPTDAVKAKYQEQASAVQSSYKEVEGETQVKVNAPVIEEVHKKHIVEEIQPVIERTTHHTHKIHTTQPIEEHVIAAAKVADIQVKRRSRWKSSRSRRWASQQRQQAMALPLPRRRTSKRSRHTSKLPRLSARPRPRPRSPPCRSLPCLLPSRSARNKKSLQQQQQQVPPRICTTSIKFANCLCSLSAFLLCL